MKRQINDRLYLKYLFQYINVDKLKQICRNFEIKGFSRKKKAELIIFILDSLAEEEYKELLQQKEIEIISNGIDLALKKIRGEDREVLVEIKIINNDDHEIELLFKGFNWDNKSFLSINSNNINDPERDCDCRIGANMGFCSHFWIGFIYTLKQNWFKLKDWTLTSLPINFESKIKNITLTEEAIGLIDESASSGKIINYLNSSITVYEAEITEIMEKESEYQDNITIFFIVSLKNIKIGPRLKKKSDYREEDIERIELLKVRISEKVQNEKNLIQGEKINFNGKLDKDNFWGLIVKNVRKVTKI